MMISFKQLKHFSLHATDDDIGGCKDILFDDQDFIMRYLVADTNTWLPLSRKVVISPIAVTKVDTDEKKIHVSMSAQTLKDSPSIDEHKPVSREYEETLFKYFGYGYYWIGPGAWGDFAHPTELADADREAAMQEDNALHSQNHLRACGEVNGYDVATTEDEVGHVTDFIFDDTSWALRLLVIDTRNWLPGGKHLAVLPSAIEHIDWSSHKVKVNLSHDALMEKPEIDVDQLDDENYINQILQQAE
ncbi:PRC-barrel domain containing protein [Alteromonas sp. ASW11-19]|uniref:PRC-barrel domain containing protein n=1 Tax=Alteromonas salexigens TaxID=2982530 RepID=A0ABT2VRB2_9ALTE|nr:PRC-barrel domain containing protein [Alteromonas salexigens]MCU7555844.1 PRC-barrel domain containing protein [Alteromonas salexigens]